MLRMQLHIHIQYKVAEVCVGPFQKLLEILFFPIPNYGIIVYETQVSNLNCIFKNQVL